MLTITSCILVLVANVFSQETCIPTGNYTLACEDFTSGPWRPIYIRPKRIMEVQFPRYITSRNTIMFTPPHGSPEPIPYQDCKFPCYHDTSLQQGQPTKLGENPSVASGAVSWKFSGWISKRIAGRNFSSISVCQSSSCEVPNFVSPHTGWIFDLEYMTTPHANKAAFISSISRAAALGPTMCFASTQGDQQLMCVEAACNVCLWNGYDGQGYCHQVVPPTSVLSTWYTDHYLSVPGYGYLYSGTGTTRAGSFQCIQGASDIDDTIASFVGNPNGQSQCGYVITGGNTCVFPTPLQQKTNALAFLQSEKVTGFVVWSPYPRNQQDKQTRFSKIKRFAKHWAFHGPSYLGFTAPITITSGSGSFYGVCGWVRDLVVQEGSEAFADTHPVFSGQPPFVTCNLFCSANCTYSRPSNQISHFPPFSSNPGQKGCLRSGNGLFLKDSSPWALLNGKYPCVSATPGALFCETELVCTLADELCGYQHCVTIFTTPVDTIQLPSGLVTKSGFQPDSTSSVVRRRRSAGLILITPKQGIMEVCAYDSDKPDSCDLTSGQTTQSFSCNSVQCCFAFPPTTFAEKSIVSIQCGATQADLVWDYSTHLTNSLIYTWAFRTFLGFPWWVQLLIVIGILWLLKFILKILHMMSIVWVTVSILKTLKDIVWDTPRYLKECGQSFVLPLEAHDFCSHCGSHLWFHHREDKSCDPDPSSPPGCPTCHHSLPSPRHWIICHLYSSVRFTFFLNPLNLARRWKLLNINYPSFDSVDKVVVHSVPTRLGPSGFVPRSLRKPVMLVSIVCLITPTTGLVNLISSGTCNGTLCNVQTKFSQEGLWQSDSSCYSVKIGPTSKTLCLSLGKSTMQLVTPIIKCRADISIQQFSNIYCAYRWGGCQYYDGSLDVYEKEGCLKVWDQERNFDGARDWGCAFSNLNTACIKAYAVDALTDTECLISTSSSPLSIVTPVCVTWENGTVCSTTGSLSISTINIKYTLVANTLPSLPTILMIDSTGKVRFANNPDNGCFLVSKQKKNGPRCATGVYPISNCRWQIDHWWSAYVVCPTPTQQLCASELDYPYYNGTCVFTKVFLNSDQNSYTLYGEGCGQTMFKISGDIAGTAIVSLEEGAVKSLLVENCYGYSGVMDSVACTITPTCSGLMRSCQMSQPVSRDLPCNQATAMAFTATGIQNVTFTCGGVSQTYLINTEIVGPDHFVPFYNSTGTSNPPIVPLLPWWAWLLIGTTCFVFFIMILSLCCLLRSKQHYKYL